MAAAMKPLAATVRSGVGKGAARSERREGRVPGVIYGGGEAAEPISLNYRELNKLIYAGHFLTTIFELDIEGRKERVIPRDYQLDVVKDTPLHVDFNSDRDSALQAALEIVVKQGYVQHGDMVVLTVGEPMGQAGGTNTLKIVRVGEHY